MKIMKSVKIVLLVVSSASLIGCASIVDGKPKKVAVKSEPPGAKITVFDANGAQIIEEHTPAVLPLKRGDGWFKGANYRLIIEKDGYQKTEVLIEPKLNGWYAGNLGFGGLIGFLAVDPTTGAMWTLSPTDINVVLRQSNAGTQSGQNGMVVMLRNDVPEEVATRLVPVSSK